MSMRIQSFETIIIFAQDFTTGGYNLKVDEWKKILAGTPAAKIRTDRIGRKKLTYEAKGNTYGWYVSFKYECTEDLVNSRIDLKLRQDDDVIKFMSMPYSKQYTPDEYDQEASEQKKKPVDIFNLIFDIKD